MNQYVGLPISEKNARFLAFLFAATMLFVALSLNLLVSIYAGLLSYGLVMLISGKIVPQGVHTARSKFIAAMAVAVFVITVFLGAGMGIHVLLRKGADIGELMEKMGEIVASARTFLPPGLNSLIPEQENLLNELSDWLRVHARDIETAGLGTLKRVGLAVFGIILGSLMAVTEATSNGSLGPVSRRLLTQFNALCGSFWRVASAQLRISALNTSLTAIYLLLILPLLQVHLPFAKTMILATFVVGLLPVIGNLISNTIITIISLSVSVNVALGSLAFLIGIHKLEYFINARIVGTHINVRAWEILLSMLVLELLFGIAGVVVAPVFYGWLKGEWRLWDVVDSKLPR